MSAQLAIQSAIVTALLAAPSVAGGQVKANSVRPLSSSQGSAVVVRLLSSVSSAGLLGAPRDWTTQFAVECLGRSAAAGSDPVAAVDAVLEQTWSRLAALQLPGLGVIDLALQPSIDWQIDDLDTPVAAATLRLVVMHRTQPITLEAQ